MLAVAVDRAVRDRGRCGRCSFLHRFHLCIFAPFCMNIYGARRLYMWLEDLDDLFRARNGQLGIYVGTPGLESA